MAAKAVKLKPHLSGVELKARARAGKSVDPKESRRWLALWHLHQGRSAREAAAACGLSHGWVCEVVRRYNAQGAAGVTSGQGERPGGPAPTLDAASQAALVAAPRGLRRPRWAGASGAGARWGGGAHRTRPARGAGLRAAARIGLGLPRGPARARQSGHARAAKGLEKKLRAELARLRVLYPKANWQLWVEDEARLGLKPIVRRVWARKGAAHRPRCPGAAASCQWLYLYGFVRPKSGATEWFLVPGVSTRAMNAVLAEFAETVGASAKKRFLVVLDGAGWHVAKDLVVPEGVHLFHLPAYTPELSPAEHLRPPIREELANHFFSKLEDLEEVLAARCRDLSGQRDFIQSTTQFHWWPKQW